MVVFFFCECKGRVLNQKRFFALRMEILIWKKFPNLLLCSRSKIGVPETGYWFKLDILLERRYSINLA